ncbi:MAG TPA: type II secretion system protein M [Rhodanobacteraceae bacterium]|nr:type II secretion system protein M [Rhodanobacteraceae bacterium]
MIAARAHRLGAAWRAREPRERAVLLAGAVLAVLLLGWAFAWHPLVEAREALGQRLASQQQNLAFMHRAQQQLASLATRERGGDVRRQGKSLLGLADASARAAHLGSAIARVSPLDARRVRIDFEGADFDSLAAWLAGLRSDYGIRADDVSIARAAGVGRVDAHVTLQEP